MPASRLQLAAIVLLLPLATPIRADDGDDGAQAPPLPGRPRVTAIDDGERETGKAAAPNVSALDDDAWRKTLEALVERAEDRGHEALASHIRS